MQPWARRLDARMLHMEAALLEAQHAMLSAAVHTSDTRHRASARELQQLHDSLLVAADAAAAAAAQARTDAATLARQPPNIIQSLFSSAYDGMSGTARGTALSLGRRFNSLVELDTKEEADAARNLIEGPSLGYRVGLDV
mmetsp:Transcript_2473/g.6612  ORF Transcript_2473/g.6612 Transcript_2473/m.6612 type:complete len:140 (-) Transcript_2473:533-952(-)